MSASSGSLPTLVWCPQCEYENEVPHKRFEKGAFFKCQNCDSEFNVFQIYRQIHDEVDIAKKIVDLYVAKIGTAYSIEPESNPYTRGIEQFLESVGFPTLMEEILVDTIVFGNAFLEPVRKEQTITLNRIDLTGTEIVTGYEVGDGKGYVERIQKLVQHQPSSREIQRKDLIHFHPPPTIGPLGLSTFGFWFSLWRILKLGLPAVTTAIVMGRKWDASNLQETVDYAKRHVTMGALIPYFLIEPYPEPHELVTRIGLSLFSSRTDQWRRILAWTVEREIFPLRLATDYDSDKHPEFALHPRTS